MTERRKFSFDVRINAGELEQIRKGLMHVKFCNKTIAGKEEIQALSDRLEDAYVAAIDAVVRAQSA
jgi:hypothetical protein